MSSAERVDVVIVGSGASGAAIGARMVENGVTTVMLEQGQFLHATDHPTFRPDWEFALTREWAYDPNVRGLEQDYPVTGEGFTPFMYNAVGGSTNHYGGFWHRMQPAEFRKGTEHGLENTIDWPISYNDLQRFYEESDRRFGVSGVSGNPAVPPREPRQMPPARQGNYYNLIADGLDNLDWHWWPGDNAIATETYRGRQACNLCGMCTFGCPRGSLGTATQAYIYPALRKGLDLRTGARVSRVSTNAAGAADGVEYIDIATGDMRRIEASVVVVACNGIGSPRLLLNSASNGHPDGLGNANDQVGRNLMIHGYVLGDMWFDEPTEHFKGTWGAALISQQFLETDVPARDAVNGMTLTFGGGLGSAASALGATTGLDPAPWGEGHHAAFQERFNHHVFVAMQIEDLPQSENRITLDPSVTDSSGIPAAQRQYSIHENDRRLFDYGTARLEELVQASGARKIDLQPYDAAAYTPPGWHLMGTCRMGNSPENSVVDRWHRVWDVPGLIVCDGSSMTTGGANNPTSTISALALRCAEGLLNNLNEPVRSTAET
jgi:2-methyl-1,2-propanediol dehydrogenase